MDLRPEKYIRSLGVGEPVKQEFSWMQYVVIQSAAPKICPLCLYQRVVSKQEAGIG